MSKNPFSKENLEALPKTLFLKKKALPKKAYAANFFFKKSLIKKNMFL